MALNKIPIMEVVNLFSLKVNDKTLGQREVKVDCPFCNENGKYHMSVSLDKDAYHCFKCDRKGGVLDLFSRLRHFEPMDSTNASNLYKELIKELGREGLASSSFPEMERINPARDENLSKAYEELLESPFLKLSKKHLQNLIERGLSEKEIQRLGYRSMPREYTFYQKDEGYKRVQRIYEEEELFRVKDQNPLTKKLPKEQILIGMLLAESVKAKGIEVSKVPGFFQLGKRDVFRFIPGMIIPTRNPKGEIVSLQVRRDEGKVRYMTISSKGYPKGVTEHIARIHMSLPFEKPSRIFLTEGPLKADVSQYLMHRRGYEEIGFIALQGVHNTADLYDLLQELKCQGVKRFNLALDMDRLTNRSVREAAKKIFKEAEEKGIYLTPLYWGKEYAAKKSKELMVLLARNHISFPYKVNPFERIQSLCEIAEENHLEPFKEGEDKWDKNTKGFDDFLNFNF